MPGKAARLREPGRSTAPRCALSRQPGGVCHKGVVNSPRQAAREVGSGHQRLSPRRPPSPHPRSLIRHRVRRPALRVDEVQHARPVELAESSPPSASAAAGDVVLGEGSRCPRCWLQTPRPASAARHPSSVVEECERGRGVQGSIWAGARNAAATSRLGADWQWCRRQWLGSRPHPRRGGRGRRSRRRPTRWTQRSGKSVAPSSRGSTNSAANRAPAGDKRKRAPLGYAGTAAATAAGVIPRGGVIAARRVASACRSPSDDPRDRRASFRSAQVRVRGSHSTLMRRKCRDSTGNNIPDRTDLPRPRSCSSTPGKRLRLVDHDQQPAAAVCASSR